MDEYWLEVSTPLGTIILRGTDKAITGVDIGSHAEPLSARQKPNALLRRAEQQLSEYFTGRRTEFDLPLSPVGTDFQHRVWQVLRRIPFGETWSYGQVALATGRPSAARAVGAACRSNPLPIVIPCHRVVGTGGKLTGFGGGLDMKAWLLDHEHIEL